jgi:hypothetical protein
VIDGKALDRAYRGRMVYWPELRDAIQNNYDQVSGADSMVVMVPKPHSGGV